MICYVCHVCYDFLVNVFYVRKLVEFVSDQNCALEIDLRLNQNCCKESSFFSNYIVFMNRKYNFQIVIIARICMLFPTHIAFTLTYQLVERNTALLLFVFRHGLKATKRTFYFSRIS